MKIKHDAISMKSWLAQAGVAFFELTGDPDPRFIVSDPSISAFSDFRLRRFLAGRYCASKALEAAGSAQRSVGRDPRSGAPLFPEGYCGSISHTQDHACAIAVASGRWAGVGLDIELESERPPEQLVLSVREREEALAAPQREFSTLLAFSAKESFYKAQWPLSQTFVDFTEVELESKPWEQALKLTYLGSDERIRAIAARSLGFWGSLRKGLVQTVFLVGTEAL